MGKSDWSGLNQLTEKMKDLDGSNKVSLSELFNEEFMSEYFSFNSFDMMLTSEGIDIKTEKDFEDIEEVVLDEIISKHSKFTTWKEMKTVAAQKWTIKKLVF